jgi:hypothetical protein
MNYYLQSSVVLFAGVLGAAAAIANANQDTAVTLRKTDTREAVLRRFLKANHSPVEVYAEAFVLEADSHELDWRLLPSLAIIESGGGQTSHHNNFFGWGNGASHFATATEAIHHVAEALSGARAYKGKDLRGKLAAYSRTPGYLRSVMDVMNRIAPSSAAPAPLPSSGEWRSLMKLTFPSVCCPGGCR